MTAPAPRPGTSSVRTLLPLVVPGIFVGVVSALLLLGLTLVADRLEDVLWTSIPQAVGVNGDSGLWIVIILTAAGVGVGLVIRYAPGHAGPDPATVGLAEPPLPPVVLPGLALAMVLMLAGGVSLGPENPILGINIGLVVAVGLRILPLVPVRAWAGLAFSGTIGAMFGTPIAAALILSEAAGDSSGRPLWDRLFGPLVAAGAGAATMNLLGGESFVLTIPAYPQAQPIDLLTGSVIAVATAAIGMIAVYVFPYSHAAFHRLRSPFIAIVVGAFLLGILGAIGGPISLFKGLKQMQELTATAGNYTVAALGAIATIKLVAVVIAGTCGFRGGRIFPSVFAAVAMGLFINALFPGIPEAITIGASLVGILVAVTRSGWLALFMAALMTGDPQLLPLLTLIVLPAWLVVTGRPEMIVKVPAARPAEAPAAAPAG
jgi:H+/Cl- antiporter ClcA